MEKEPVKGLPAQSKQMKHKKMRNMFKINNKDTRTPPLTGTKYLTGTRSITFTINYI